MLIIMKIEGRHFEHRLAAAEQEEILESSDVLLAGLRELVTEENVEGGLQLNFGANRESFTRCIEVLGLPDALAESPESPSQAMLFGSGVRTGSITSFIDLSLPYLRRLDLTQAVEAMQADGWGVGEYTYPQVQPMGTNVESQLIVGNLASDGGLDIQKPVVAVGLECQYLPTFDNPNTGTGPSLAYFLRDQKEENRGGDMSHPAIPELIEYMQEKGVRLAVAQSDYYLKIGHLKSPKDVSVLRDNRYIVKNGRIVHIPPPNYPEIIQAELEKSA